MVFLLTAVAPSVSLLWAEEAKVLSWPDKWYESLGGGVMSLGSSLSAFARRRLIYSLSVFAEGIPT